MTKEEKILELLERQTALLSDISTGQAAIEGQIGRLESKQQFWSMRMDKLERAQLALEGRFGRLEEHTSPKPAGQTQALLAEDAARADLQGDDPQSRIEALEDDVSLLKQVIRSMSQEIAELKKAQ